MTYKDTINAHGPILYRLNDGTLNTNSSDAKPFIDANAASTTSVTLGSLCSASYGTIGCRLKLHTAALNSSPRLILGTSACGIFLQTANSNYYFSYLYSYVSGTETAIIPVAKYNHEMHVCMTWNFDTQILKFYLDGIEFNRTTFAAAASTGASFTVGLNNTTQGSSGGHSIWDIVTYNRELSSAEVLSVFNNSLPATPTVYWPGNEGTGNTFFNSGGTSGINLVFSGMTWGPDANTWTNVGSVTLANQSLRISDGYSAYFSGVGTEALYGKCSASPSNTKGPIITEFWIKPNSIKTTDNLNHIFSGYTTLFGVSGVDKFNSGDLRKISPAGLAGIGPAAFIESSKVQHVVLDWNMSTDASLTDRIANRIYINGELVSEALSASGFTFATVPLNLVLGSVVNSTTPTFTANTSFDGYISDFAIYRKPWKPEYTKMHYLAGTDSQSMDIVPSIVSAEVLDNKKIRLAFNKPIFEVTPSNISGINISKVDNKFNGIIDIYRYVPPVFHARLTESSGPFVESINSANSLSIGAGVTRDNGRVGLGAPKFTGSGAILFGVNDEIFKSDFTVSCWIARDIATLPARCELIGTYTTADPTGWAIGLSSFATVHIRLGSNDVSFTMPQGLRQWAHYTVCIDKSHNEIRLFLNGIYIGLTRIDSTSQGLKNKFNNSMYVGNQVDANFTGRVQDVQIFDYALSDEEIKNLYEQNVTGTCLDVSDPPDDEIKTITITNAKDAWYNDLTESLSFQDKIKISNITLENSVVAPSLTGYVGDLLKKTEYKMRGKYSVTGQYHYWTSLNTPDWLGVSSGVNSANLSDIILISKIES